jgi:hypothetical protein
MGSRTHAEYAWAIGHVQRADITFQPAQEGRGPQGEEGRRCWGVYFWFDPFVLEFRELIITFVVAHDIAVDYYENGVGSSPWCCH